MTDATRERARSPSVGAGGKAAPVTPTGARESGTRGSGEGSSVSEVVERQVLPRLVLSHRGEGPRAVPRALPAPAADPAEIAELAELVLREAPEPAERFLDARRHRGLRLEELYVAYLSPAARLLGELWEDDRVSFTQVTIGVGRLQQLQHRLSDCFEQDLPPRINSRRILLAAAPGEQHTFGLSIVASCFRAEGWDVAGGPGTDETTLLDAVQGHWFDLVGLSISADRHLEALSRLIRRVRRASRNRSLGVVVGGPLLEQRADLARLTGADAAMTDATRAPAEARAVVELLVTN
jgi:methylmalonyl-CoA mutase cobalamin-binding domain/chain